MAAGTLPRPGSKFGPCANNCSHIDCAKTHEMAETKCRICGKPIGYETPFYNEGGLVHASCYEDEIEKGAKQGN